MNRMTYFSLILLSILLLSSCAKDKCTETHTYIADIPVYITEADLHPDIAVEGPRMMEETGKIYFYNNFILINEKRKGIHVIDNNNPSAPEPVAFIAVPGNIDMAVKNNILYADSYLDLLAIDISNPTQAVLVDRDEKVIPPIWTDPQRGHLVYYNQEEVTEEVDCNRVGNNNGQIFDEFDVFVLGGVSQASTSGANIPAQGIGGSFARFTLANNHLYVIDDSDLYVFDVANPSTPSLVNTVSIAWNIETIFPYEDKLFIGSTSGMYIYDNSNPEEPTYLSAFQHANACDPVFVDGDYAYVTLRSGNQCDGFTDQLELIDIKEVTSPVLLKTFPMDNPHGLTKNGDMLFVCEGKHGLKAFNAAVPENLDENLTAHFKDFATYDAISLNNGLLMVIGADGLYQYDFSNPEELREISFIKVKN